MNTVFLIAFVLSITFTTIQSLSCVACDQWTCTSDEKLNCTGGLTLGICGCCNVCAKVEGEECGGLWNFSGTCDKGLTCVLPNVPDQPDSLFFPHWLKGICMPKNIQH